MTAPQGEPTTAPGAPGGTAPTAPTPTPAAPAGSPPASPWEGFQWDGKVESLPEPVAKLIRDTRQEAGAARTTAKAQAAQEARNELLAQISGVLGVDGGGQPPTVEQLTAQARAYQAQIASMTAERRVIDLGTSLGLSMQDVADLLDSNRVCEQLDAIGEQIQPGDVAAFDAAAGEVIKKWAEGRPRPVTATSTTPVTALRPGALPGAAEVSLDDQIAEAQKSGNFRAVIALQNRKIQSQ